MENLAHSASFHSNEKSAPSKPGTKQLPGVLRLYAAHLAPCGHDGVAGASVFTQDSIGNGPTRQPVEYLASRAIPNMLVLRPADAVEAAECWQIALGDRTGSSSLIMLWVMGPLGSPWKQRCALAGIATSAKMADSLE